MALQTSVSNSLSVSLEGQLVEARRIASATNRAGSALTVGRFVAIDTDSAAEDMAVDALASGDTAANVAGILLHSHAVTTLGATAPATLEDKCLGNILKDGCAWVYCEQAVTQADPVYVRIITAGGGADIGQVRKDADSANAVVLAAARFDSVTTGAGLVKVSIKLP